jgi:hypothetical protein
MKRSAFPAMECSLLERSPVQDVHADDGLAYFLSVCPDVLNRRCSHQSGNAGETLHAPQSFANAAEHKCIPDLSGRGFHENAVAVIHHRHARQSDMGNQSFNPFVGDDRVAAAAEDMEAGHTDDGGTNCFAKLVDGRARCELFGGAAETEGRKSCKGDVALDGQHSDNLCQFLQRIKVVRAHARSTSCSLY